MGKLPEPLERWRRIKGAFEEGCETLKIGDVIERPVRGLCCVDPAAKLPHALDKLQIGAFGEIAG